MDGFGWREIRFVSSRVYINRESVAGSEYVFAVCNERVVRHPVSAYSFVFFRAPLSLTRSRGILLPQSINPLSPKPKILTAPLP